MEENKNNMRDGEERGAEYNGVGAPEGEAVRSKMSFGKWAENVWYHYKWHIVAALVVIFMLAVCITQCASTATAPADIHIVYAGSKQLSTTVDEATGKAPFAAVEGTLETLIGDYDENGERVVDLESYYWLSSTQLDELEEKNATLPKNEQIDVTYHASVIYNNKNSIDSLMLQSDYYVWLISEALYSQLLTASGGADRFIDLSTVVGGEEVGYYVNAEGAVDTHAVYLKDLYIYDLAGMDNLPEDTLVVLRTPTVLDGAEEYEVSREFVKKILTMK